MAKCLYTVLNSQLSKRKSWRIYSNLILIDWYFFIAIAYIEADKFSLIEDAELVILNSCIRFFCRKKLGNRRWPTDNTFMSNLPVYFLTIDIIKLRMEMGNVPKRQQPDHRADNSRKSPSGLHCNEKFSHRRRPSAGL